MNKDKNLLPFERMTREVFVRREAETSLKFGLKPEQRDMQLLIDYGIINIDKPKGPTSHQVSSYAQKILELKKGGHGGTLDPGVTGVLPIALSKATRVIQALLPAGKEYVCIMHLHKEVPDNKVKEVCKSFVGKIKQLPPIKSAIKRQERYRKIHYLKVLEIKEKDVLFIVGCQAGTYIRKLCLHPQTGILTKEGLMTASDFYSNHSKIYSFNKGKKVRKTPSATQKLKSPSKLAKITMASGISFIVTLDHELYTSTGTGYKMKETKDLKQGDYIVKSLVYPNDGKEYDIADLLDDNYLIQQPEIKEECKNAFIKKYGSIRMKNRKLKLDRKSFLLGSENAITIKHLKLAGIYEKVKKNIYVFKTQKGSLIKIKRLNEDLFYLLGLIASDGNNTKEKKTVRFTRVKFHNKNEKLIESFSEIYKKLFPNISISKKAFRKDLIELDTTNSFLATIAASLGIKSPQKNSDLLPILNAKTNLIKSFLKGYFDGDGSAHYKKRINSSTTDSYIRFHTVSHNCALRLHSMLLKVGIPNKIFYKKKNKMYDISLESLAAKRKFIKEIGSNHPFKLEKFKKIMTIKNNAEIDDHFLIAFHYKEMIRNNKSKLHKMGGNLNRVLKNKMPITKRFYNNAGKIVKLPKLDEFIIEKIKSIKLVNGTDYVYDMTVPGTHNFLIETGFVSSNCHDIGQKLGVGAHMAELRRTKAGPFNESTIVTLQDLTDAFYYYKENGDESQLRKYVQPMEAAVRHLPKIWVLDTTVSSLCHGANLKVPGVSKLESDIQVDEMVAVMSLKGELIGLGQAKMISKQMVKEEKGIAVNMDKIFMPRETYPKIETK